MGILREVGKISTILLSDFIIVSTVLPHPDDFSSLISFKHHFFAEGFISAYTAERIALNVF